MPLLSIRNLIKVYQTEEGMFGKTKREVHAVNGCQSNDDRAIAPISQAP